MNPIETLYSERDQLKGTIEYYKMKKYPAIVVDGLESTLEEMEKKIMSITGHCVMCGDIAYFTAEANYREGIIHEPLCGNCLEKNEEAKLKR